MSNAKQGWINCELRLDTNKLDILEYRVESKRKWRAQNSFLYVYEMALKQPIEFFINLIGSHFVIHISLFSLSHFPHLYLALSLSLSISLSLSLSLSLTRSLSLSLYLFLSFFLSLFLLNGVSWFYKMYMLTATKPNSFEVHNIIIHPTMRLCSRVVHSFLCFPLCIGHT